MYKNFHKKTCIVLILIFLLTIFQPINLANQTKNSYQTYTNNQQEIKVAILLQNWDYMDIIIRLLIFPSYQNRFKEIERDYNIKINLHVFRDTWFGGDVQKGKLKTDGIDIAIAPGGTGGWYCPERFRNKITEFVSTGGGFFGICGDSALGTSGYINAPEDVNKLLFRLFLYREITDPLGFINVYTDVEPITEHFKNKLRQNTLYVLLFLKAIQMSDSEIYLNNELPFAQDLAGEKISATVGMAPMVKIPGNGGLDTSFYEIGTFGDSNSPYNPRFLEGKYAIVASEYGIGRVVLSAAHPEMSYGMPDAHKLFNEALLWLAKINCN